jgi:hypothetical protein
MEEDQSKKDLSIILNDYTHENLLNGWICNTLLLARTVTVFVYILSLFISIKQFKKICSNIKPNGRETAIHVDNRSRNRLFETI